MAQWIRSNRAFLLFILLFGLFRTSVADWNPVPTGSMRPTILEGDVVLINRLAYSVKLPLTDIVIARVGEPKRGDIVTFTSPKDSMRLIKRMVAIPGDTVEMRDKVLVINGEPAKYEPIGTVLEPVAPGLEMPARRLNEITHDKVHVVQWLSRPGDSLRDLFGPITIPPDCYLMLGDNRDNSADSRYIGLVPRHLLIGQAFAILVSADMLGNWAPRFERFGEKLN